MRKLHLAGLAVFGLLFGWAGQARGTFIYEPVHNVIPSPGTPDVRLSSIPDVGLLQPEQELLILVTGRDNPAVLNDTPYILTGFHWEIPATDDPRIAPGTLIPGSGGLRIPAGWVQPDVALGDFNGDGVIGVSDMFPDRIPTGPGPTRDLWFVGGAVLPGTAFTDFKLPGVVTGDVIPAHFALVSYAGVPVPEPSSLVLASLAGIVVTAYTWRRRRRATDAEKNGPAAVAAHAGRGDPT